MFRKTFKKLCSSKFDENCCRQLFAALGNVMNDSEEVIEDVPRNSSERLIVAIKPNTADNYQCDEHFRCLCLC